MADPHFPPHAAPKSSLVLMGKNGEGGGCIFLSPLVGVTLLNSDTVEKLLLTPQLYRKYIGEHRTLQATAFNNR